MDAIELLITRSSNGKLQEPAPDATTLALAVQAALRAPDHANLRPWRLQIVRGDARARLGDVFADALAQRQPGATQAELDKVRGKPLRAPLIIIVSTRHTSHPKVPAIEQVLSAGAAAQNLLLVLQARGFAGLWRTGAPTYDPHVARALGLGEQDQIVGFIYAGTPARPAPDIRRPSPEEHVEEWEGERGERPGSATIA